MDAVVVAGPSRPRGLAVTLALVASAVVLAVVLTYLLGHTFGPLRLRGRRASGRRRTEAEGGRAAADDAAPAEAGETAAVTEDAVAEAGGTAAVMEEVAAETGETAAVMEEAEAAVAEEPVAEPQPAAKPRRRLRGLLGWAIYLAVIVGAIVIGPTALGWALGSEYPMAAISSGSMWPALKEGDVVLLKGVDSTDDVKVGDIIAFNHKDGFAIHRVASIDGDQITTKGDANTREDEPIAIEDVIGKVPTIAGTTARIPYLGNISFLLAPLMNGTDDPAQPPLSPSEDGGGGPEGEAPGGP